MKNDSLISIIVPIYNVEPYLNRCVDSIINQTYHNLEIILVDDGSPDRCGAICDNYASKDGRIKVIHKQNGGLADARNTGIEVVTGDYVLFLDSDDWLELNACELLLSEAHRFGADIVVFGRKYVYENGKVVDSKIKEVGIIPKSDCMKGLIYKIEENGIFNSSCNKFYKSELLLDLRFPVGMLAEDQGFTYKIIDKADVICMSQYNLYNYFQRDGSISHNEFYPELRMDEYQLWFERLYYLKENYPKLVRYQEAQLLGDMYISQYAFRNRTDCNDLMQLIASFISSQKGKVAFLSKYNRRVWLHHYFYPLFVMYLKLKLKLR